MLSMNDGSQTLLCHHLVFLPIPPLEQQCGRQSWEVDLTPSLLIFGSGQGSEEVGFLQIFNLHRTNEIVRQLCASPRLAAAAADLLGASKVTKKPQTRT